MNETSSFMSEYLISQCCLFSCLSLNYREFLWLYVTVSPARDPSVYLAVALKTYISIISAPLTVDFNYIH